MKHLRTSLKSFRELFERSIPVAHLAEPLVSFDEGGDPLRVLADAQGNGFDVLGYRRHGKVVGTVKIAEIGDRSPNDAVQPLGPADVIEADRPMLEVYRRIQGRKFLLVADRGAIWGIVTLGDLQKMPSRIWLFGVVSLVEMHAVRLLKQSGPPPDQWERIIGKSQYEKCQQSHERLKKAKLDLGIADSLQLKDEFDLLCHDRQLLQRLGFTSSSGARKLANDLSGLRNALAHSRPIGGRVLKGLAGLMDRAETFIRMAEALES